MSGNNKLINVGLRVLQQLLWVIYLVRSIKPETIAININLMLCNWDKQLENVKVFGYIYIYILK